MIREVTVMVIVDRDCEVFQCDSSDCEEMVMMKMIMYLCSLILFRLHRNRKNCRLGLKSSRNKSRFEQSLFIMSGI